MVFATRLTTRTPQAVPAKAAIAVRGFADVKMQVPTNAIYSRENAGTRYPMNLIYYAHSYRPPDKDVNEFFQELMLSEGMTPSLDPPAEPGHLNAAKPERHLRSTDGVVVVLPHRDPEPSSHILYEIALGVRAHKPVLVFVEDVLPADLVPTVFLRRRFSRRHFLREIRNHRHALTTLKSYIGSDSPPTYDPNPGQRSCLLVGMSRLTEAQRNRICDELARLRYYPVVAPAGEQWLSYDSSYETLVAQSGLCVAFVEHLLPQELYVLGAARAALTPTILLTENSGHRFNPRVPLDYQARQVSCDDMDGLCQLLEKEIGIFEEDFMELKDQEKVLHYRTGLIREGRNNGVYSSQTRDVFFNLVTGSVGEIDMSRDKVQISHSVGPINIKSHLDHVSQIVSQAPAIAPNHREQFANLILELQKALEAAGSRRPDDTERVAKTAELVATELAKEKPDKGFLNITAEGLKQAAKTVEDIAPAVISVAAKVATFIAGLSL